MGEPGPKGEQVSHVRDHGTSKSQYQMLHNVNLIWRLTLCHSLIQGVPGAEGDGGEKGDLVRHFFFLYLI